MVRLVWEDKRDLKEVLSLVKNEETITFKEIESIKTSVYDKRKEACCAFGSDEVMLIYMHLVLKFSEIFSVHNV